MEREERERKGCSFFFFSPFFFVGGNFLNTFFFFSATAFCGFPRGSLPAFFLFFSLSAPFYGQEDVSHSRSAPDCQSESFLSRSNVVLARVRAFSSRFRRRLGSSMVSLFPAQPTSLTPLLHRSKTQSPPVLRTPGILDRVGGEDGRARRGTHSGVFDAANVVVVVSVGGVLVGGEKAHAHLFRAPPRRAPRDLVAGGREDVKKIYEDSSPLPPDEGFYPRRAPRREKYERSLLRSTEHVVFFFRKKKTSFPSLAFVRKKNTCQPPLNFVKIKTTHAHIQS